MTARERYELYRALRAEHPEAPASVIRTMYRAALAAEKRSA